MSTMRIVNWFSSSSDKGMRERLSLPIRWRSTTSSSVIICALKFGLKPCSNARHPSGPTNSAMALMRDSLGVSDGGTGFACPCNCSRFISEPGKICINVSRIRFENDCLQRRMDLCNINLRVGFFQVFNGLIKFFLVFPIGVFVDDFVNVLE